MKKLITSVLLCCLLVSLSVSVAAAPSTEYASIAVGAPLSGADGSVLGAAYVDQNSRTLVPLRALANLLGLSVAWDGATRTATFQKNGTTTAFVQDSSSYVLNGETKTMDTAVVNKEGRVYAPARYLAEAFGYTVGWEGATRTVTFSVNNATASFAVKSGNVKASDISFKTYNYSTNYSRYHVTVITNNSNSACKLTLETTFLDAEGKPVDLSSSSISALAPHTSVAVYDMPDYAYEKVTNKYTLEEFRYYTATTQNLSVSHNIMESNVIGTVTNNGTLAAEFTEVTALFFKDGQLVNIDRTYAVDSDYHIAPGMSESFKCSSYNEFDTVEFYLDSRGSRS